jgi:hypothetical protein
MDRWSRRQFVQGTGVAGLGLLVGCGRLPWQAPARPWRLGFLAPAAANQPETMPQYAALWEGLRETGD